MTYYYKVKAICSTNAEASATSDAVKVHLPEKLEDVKLSTAFATYKDMYKYRSRGSHVYANPIVRNAEGEILEKNVDYTVTYSSKERVLPGKYTIKVKGIGNYIGTVEKVLIITPKSVENVNVRRAVYKDGYNDAYVTWAKSEGADGYQVYSRRPTKSKEWTYLGKTTNTSYLKKDLYNGWKYEFKVIPYKVVDEIRFRSLENYKIVTMTTLMKVSKPTIKKYPTSTIEVLWKSIPGEPKYQIMMSRNGEAIYFTTSNKSIKLHVIKNKKYTYKVRAYEEVKKAGKIYKVYAPWSNATEYTLR